MKYSFPPIYKRLRQRRLWRLIAVPALLLALYSLSGFILLPLAIKYFLTHGFAQSIHQNVQISEVLIDPFRMSLGIKGMQVNDSSGAPLLAFEQLFLDYEVTSFWRSEYGIEQFTIEKPYVKLVLDAEGNSNLATLFSEDSSKSKKPATEKLSTVLPAVWVKKLALNNGILNIHYQHQKSSLQQKLNIVKFEAEDLHTLKSDHANRLTLEIHDNDNGIFSATSELRFTPLQATGELIVKKANLLPILQMMPATENVFIQAPRLDLQTGYVMRWEKDLSVKLQKGRVNLRELGVSHKAKDPHLVLLPSIEISGIDMQWPQQALTVGKITAKDGSAQLTIDKMGNNNLQALFTTELDNKDNQPPHAAAGKIKPWDVTINRLSLENFTVQLRDEKPSTPFEIKVSPISIGIDKFKPLNTDEFPLQMSLGLPQDGKVAVDARVKVAPLQVQGNATINNIALAMLQPYIDDSVRADIKEAYADAGMTFSITDHEANESAAPNALQFNVDGQLNVRQLDIQEKINNTKLVSWESFAIDKFSYVFPANTLNVQNIHLTKPFGSLVINPDSTTNLHDLAIPKDLPAQPVQENNPAINTGDTAVVASPSPNPTPSPENKPLQIEVATVTIDDGDMSFADLSLTPNFRVAMQQMHGQITGISSRPETQALVELQGKVDRYAPITIRSNLNFWREKPQLDTKMTFKNIELTTFTPYSGTYAGFVIEKGQISVDLDYKLVDKKIKGKNRIVMNQLQLGKQVKSTKAVDLPLRLAVALLRDEHGVIDLGFDVGGDIDDPKFSVRSMVFKVFKKVIKKAVKSPFQFLADVVGGRHKKEDVSQLLFVAGSDKLDPTADSKLQTVAAMLNKRSMLYVNIQGSTLIEKDRPSLQQQKLLRLLTAESKLSSERFLSAQAAVANSEAYLALARHYKKQRAEDITDLQTRVAEELRSKGQSVDPITLDKQVYERAWSRLVDDIAINDDDLRQLALRRADHIKGRLIDEYHLAPERVFVLDAYADAAQGSLAAQLSLDTH